MGSRLAFVRRYGRWLIALALLPLLGLLIAVVLAYEQGIRVESLGWHDGLELTQWQRLQSGCVSAMGSRLRITGWYPLTIAMTDMHLPKCPTAPKELSPPPWTPPFDLSIAALTVPGLPPIAVVIHQREQRWHAQARHRHSQATAVYDRPSGRWSAQGQLQAADIAPQLLGALNVTGKGGWLPHRLEGALQAEGQQLGYAGQPQRGSVRLEAALAAKQWRVNAALGAPLAVGGGWRLEAGHALRASGSLDGVQSLNLNMLATGPQGNVRLALNTEGGNVARGQGSLALAGAELAGTVPIRWNRQELTLLPAAVQLPAGLRLRWPRPLVLPLALAGSSSISAELQYQELRFDTVDSRLSWQQARWSWQGRLELAGRAGGHELTGTWQGHIDAAGLSGDPASLTIKGPELMVTLRLPVADLHPPRWSTQAQFNGRYRHFPVSGVLSAGYAAGRWAGVVDGRSKLPFYTQGGELAVASPWYGKEGQWFLDSGSRITIAKGLIATTLLKPMSVTAATPLRIGPKGVFGTLQISADGAVGSRWILPNVAGQLTVAGRQGKARLSLPAWQSELTMTATMARSSQRTGAQGTVTLTAPLSATMSRGLGVTLQKGMLNGQGRWQWQDHWRLQGDIAVSGLTLNWGSVLASDGNGAAHIELDQNGVTLTSIGPITLAELGIGTQVRNAHMTVQSDLSTWHFTDVYAEVLGGIMSAASLQWPSQQYQTVAVSHLDLAQVAALQNDPNPTVQLAGRVGGNLPLQLMKDDLALRDGFISNEGPVSLKILPSAGISSMGQSNQAVQLALDTLSNLAIHDFHARLNMKPDGWLDAAVTIKGRNPQQNSLPVVLNYSHRENVLELLRSLRIGDELARRAMHRKPAEGLR
ncbi:YdbH domain-containing protein [Crenobacter sp. SG2303]|uniref:YdbH domain-containing protein n=1 Tax=Crenobacter oryzisoli TaxID=3056844 RepID=A0ABT7XLG0_9NEIS|nr:YdbH domain-containing protein [Crenobacter sp. SG2303]MDN0074585.1 YdbH domain-containing protein [Crenobacter sp. SG2303]